MMVGKSGEIREKKEEKGKKIVFLFLNYWCIMKSALIDAVYNFWQIVQKIQIMRGNRKTNIKEQENGKPV